MTAPWEPPDSPAGSVEEAAGRFLEAAQTIKAHLSLGRGPGRLALKMEFADEMVLRALDLGHQVLTGQPLPDEFQLEPGKHFGVRRLDPKDSRVTSG